MMKPNWFDTKFEQLIDGKTVDEVLLAIARDQKIREFVRDAVAENDLHRKEKGWVGPSRTQVIRTALVEILSAD